MGEIKRCPLCKRSKAKAIQEQLSQFSNCGIEGCAFASEINQAINNNYNTMICKKCGKQNEVNATHCIHCNALLKKAVKTNEDKKHTIFISHAVADKDIVADFCELLQVVLCARPFDYKIFCSSEIGCIECGKDSIHTIHANLSNCNSAFCILTDNSYNRPWVMYEIGFVKGKSSKKNLMLVDINVTDKNVIKNGLPYSKFHIYKCDEQHLFSLMIELLNNIIPNSCNGQEAGLKRLFAPHIKSFLEKINNYKYE